MPDWLERFVLWLGTKEGKKVFRYSMVSVISTGVSFSVLFIVYGVAHVWSEVPSTVFANAMAAFPSYWLNRRWAWGKTSRSHLLKEVLPFWAIAAFGIAFSIVGASIVHDVLKHHFLHQHVIATSLVLLANLGSFGLLWIAKLALFNRLFHVPSLLEEIEEHVEHEAEGSDAPIR